MKQVIPNPTGKGGFQEHPENRGSGTWDAKMTFSYQYKKFLNMDIEEFKTWTEENPKRTMVEELAWTAIFKARKELKERIEIANRTEGMPQQPTDITTDGEKIESLIIYRPERNSDNKNG